MQQCSSFFSGNNGMMGTLARFSFGFGHVTGLLVLLAGLAVLFYWWRTSHQDSRKQNSEAMNPELNALQILEVEFAKGALTESEYLRKKSILEQ